MEISDELYNWIIYCGATIFGFLIILAKWDDPPTSKSPYSEALFYVSGWAMFICGVIMIIINLI